MAFYVERGLAGERERVRLCRMADAASRLAREIETYRRVENIHDLPDIFHYWSNTYLRPHIAEIFGSDNLHEALAGELIASLRAAHGNPHILSVGSGDSCVEIGLARRMLAQGFSEFCFTCVELSPHLVERAKAAALEAGLSHHFQFEIADLSNWRASRIYGAAFAHHSLHHIEALEHVFDQVRDHLEDGASFVVSDMIGRNGHMRWPEALEIISGIWAQIPERYKWHHIFARKIDPYLNWDCTDGGRDLEGIRAQDIMPELLKRFQFEKLCVWGSLTDIFIDRGYGHNLDPDNPEDRLFIDELWHKEKVFLQARHLKPTQMAAVMRVGAPTTAAKVSFGLTPEQCVRRA